MSRSLVRKTVLVVNPKSANGTVGRNWTKIDQEIRRWLKAEYDVRFTMVSSTSYQ